MVSFSLFGMSESNTYILLSVESMAIVRIKHWYEFYKLLLCRVGIHQWMEVKYRKRDRTLLVWEECRICRKVKED